MPRVRVQTARTTTLIGDFHVVTGQLLASTLGPTRTEPVFVQHVAQRVAWHLPQ
jgi:hypothetical protein